eukprot:2764379-Rhodomonas_salina.1
MPAAFTSTLGLLSFGVQNPQLRDEKRCSWGLTTVILGSFRERKVLGFCRSITRDLAIESPRREDEEVHQV